VFLVIRNSWLVNNPQLEELHGRRLNKLRENGVGDGDVTSFVGVAEKQSDPMESFGMVKARSHSSPMVKKNPVVQFSSSSSSQFLLVGASSVGRPRAVPCR